MRRSLRNRCTQAKGSLATQSHPYTEHEDTSGCLGCGPLITGGVVFLIRVHHSDIEGAGLTCGQELVLRGGGAEAAESGGPSSQQPRPGRPGAVAIQVLEAPACHPAVWPRTGWRRPSLPKPAWRTRVTGAPGGPIERPGPFHSVHSPEVSEAGFNRRRFCAPLQPAGVGWGSQHVLLLELGVVGAQGPDEGSGVWDTYLPPQGAAPAPGALRPPQVTTHPAWGRAKANARAE